LPGTNAFACHQTLPDIVLREEIVPEAGTQVTARRERRTIFAPLSSEVKLANTIIFPPTPVKLYRRQSCAAVQSSLLQGDRVVLSSQQSSVVFC